MIFLIGIMSFANFVFYPLVIGFIIALVIEQIFRAQKKPPEIFKSMAVRKFLWRQNIILNFSWFLCYFILMFLLRGQQTPMPDMIWQG